MRSLSDQEKKLFSRIGIALGAMLVLALSYVSIVNLESYWDVRYMRKEQKLIEQYNKKVDSLKVYNVRLLNEVHKLEGNVDSLKKIDNKIFIAYEKKVNVINDASARNHAEWMDSVITKLNNQKR